ncbi:MULTISPECIES: protoporphyrinogen oxidase [Mycobacterium avium complex (MAC)]|uniref:Coproporphyrinogen III oxidase n=7 Tax=Mycobacterium avium complex (MAC) TaxID=120793 RepID=A0AAW5S5S5_MYCBC|nr:MULTISPECIES: protoporphyrinogen oxidase [Mycobacterium avium complex (MAC)]MBZ4534059.1 protoporphyrinogen oxidase [Mycobacterium avium subsp. hominissuis]MBZ4592827.1 protoporphyrinogen oxidase [Mycobacterium avium subsp. hominissuis]MBZ4634645.1 protoporphyrinogen oxidase [Mycobacterium avium subsp. hominissuis]MCV6990345.1 protoporphyrinogen oxidase [Mycobacterium bouchedurhonense]MCV6996192.1 protoporphyrinogen oxidase [Mycobacterium timonense]
MTARSYCVVGGGISGLTAAYRLRVAAGDDAVITLLDPAPRLGGILRTEPVGGVPMDLGAEAFVLRRPELPALLSELNLTGRQRVSTGARPLIYSRGRLHPLPTGTVVGIPSSAASMAGLVDEATLARIDAEPRRPLRWRPGSDPAVADLVGDRFGEQVVSRSVDPLLSGVYAGSAATIGLRAAAPTVAAALDRGAASLTDAVRRALPPATGAPVFGALDGGYRVLVDELVARARPRRVRAAAARLEPAGPGWAVVDDAGARRHADAVILAVPAREVARLLAGIAPRSAAAAGRVVAASSVVLALAVPGDTAFPDCSGVLVATGERLRAKAITLSSKKWGTRADVQLLRLSFGRFGDQVAARTPDEELRGWALADLAAVFGLDVRPVDVRVQRWLDAMPQYGPGHAELVGELRAGLPPTLAVAGGYLDGIGVPACVGAAGRAVEALQAEVAR